MPEQSTHNESIQPILDLDVEYPRRITRSVEELAAYQEDAEALFDTSDQHRFGQVILGGEHFWHSHEA